MQYSALGFNDIHDPVLKFRIISHGCYVHCLNSSILRQNRILKVSKKFKKKYKKERELLAAPAKKILRGVKLQLKCAIILPCSYVYYTH